MADEILKRDQNHVTVIAGVTDDSEEDITMVRQDPITKELLVKDTLAEEALASLVGFDIPEYDEINLSYDVDDNLTGVVYKLATVVVATLTLTYTAGNLTSVIKS